MWQSIAIGVLICVAIFIALGILSSLVSRNGRNVSGPTADEVPPVIETPQLPVEKYRYSRKENLITSAEKELFLLLNEVYGRQYYIFPQVHLSTLLNHTIYGQNWKGALAHIDRKSVDFVVCDKNTFKPLLAIELDDNTHSQSDRWERDCTVEQIFRGQICRSYELKTTEVLQKKKSDG